MWTSCTKLHQFVSCKSLRARLKKNRLLKEKCGLFEISATIVVEVLLSLIYLFSTYDQYIYM
jgi:hypothetical protein